MIRAGLEHSWLCMLCSDLATEGVEARRRAMIPSRGLRSRLGDPEFATKRHEAAARSVRIYGLGMCHSN
jgi:hypothetical protein